MTLFFVNPDPTFSRRDGDIGERPGSFLNEEIAVVRMNAKSILLGVVLLTAGATANGWWYAWTVGREFRAVGEKLDHLIETQDRSTEQRLAAQARSTEQLLRASDQILRATDQVLAATDRVGDRLDGIAATLVTMREDQIRILERESDAAH